MRRTKLLSQREFEPILNRLMKYNGVWVVVVSNEEGFPLAFRSKRSDYSYEDAEVTAALVASLVGKAQMVVEKLNNAKLNFFTLDTTQGEMLIALENDYIIIALREPKQKSSNIMG